jgi:hypothetical protein
MLPALPALAQSQEADPHFDAHVSSPTYTSAGPTVAVDEAHFNFHTASGRYAPFAELLRNDGYTVRAANAPFSAAALESIDVLVISNAGIMNPAGPATPAFTAAECAAVRDWVRAGGSLGEHAILSGRHAGEEVDHVRSFTGQSLTVPAGATASLRFAASAREAPLPSDLDAIGNAVAAGARDAAQITATHSLPIAGRAQGLAMPFGAGRVVMLGEAAMLTAQIATIPGDNGQPRSFPFGMNVPGTDDKQFALNVLHWLSRTLQ